MAKHTKKPNALDMFGSMQKAPVQKDDELLEEDYSEQETKPAEKKPALKAVKPAKSNNKRAESDALPAKETKNDPIPSNDDAEEKMAKNPDKKIFSFDDNIPNDSAYFVRKTFYMTYEEIVALDNISRREHYKKSDLIRNLLDSSLNEYFPGALEEAKEEANEMRRAAAERILKTMNTGF